jgi:hypothetical protein
MPDRTAILSTLAKTMARQDPAAPLAVRLCTSAVILLRAHGASVTLAYTEDERVTLCSTDEVAERLEDLQEVLGQGPGRDAYLSGLPQVLEVTGTPDPRWPEFCAASHASLGSMRVHAVPIRPDHATLGVLTCHLPPGLEIPLAPEETQFIADAVGVALIRDPHATDTDLSGPWSERAQVHQATGMVVAQLHVSADDALALLRAHAFAAETTLRTIAKDVVGRRLDFRTTDTSGDDRG